MFECFFFQDYVVKWKCFSIEWLERRSSVVTYKILEVVLPLFQVQDLKNTKGSFGVQDVCEAGWISNLLLFPV